MAKTKTTKKAGVTRKKHERKKKPLQAYLLDINGTFVLCRKSAAYAGERAILYSGKLDKTWSKPLAVAKYLSKKFALTRRSDGGYWSKSASSPRGTKRISPQNVQKVGKYLEDQQPVFAKMDHKIVDIVNQHPDFTIKEITAELDKQYPGRKFETLARRVQRLLKNVPRQVPR